MTRTIYRIYSADFRPDGNDPHFRMGIGEASFPSEGIEVFIDNEHVGIWKNHYDNLWIHFDDGVIDSFLFRKKNTGTPTWA